MTQHPSHLDSASHSDSITALVFHPDGTALISGSYDQTALVWNVSDGTVRRVLPLREFVSGMALAPDGHTLITDDDGQVFDLPTGQVLRTLRDCIAPLACSPDGKFLASCGFNREGEGWVCVLTDLRFRHKKRRFPCGIMQPECIAFSADGALVGVLGTAEKAVEEAEANFPSIITLYAIETDTMRQTLRGIPVVALFGVRFSAAARLLAVTCDGQIFDAESEQLVSSMPVQMLWREYGCQPYDSPCFALSADARLLAFGTTDGQVGVQSLVDSQLLWSRQGHDGWIRKVVFSPDGSTLASGGDDHEIHLWDAPSGTVQRTFGRKRLTVEAVAFSADGRFLTALYEDKAARWWNLDTARVEQIEIEPFGVLHRSVRTDDSRAVSPDNRLTAVVEQQDICLRDTQTGELMKKLAKKRRGNRFKRMHEEERWYEPDGLAFSPDGKLLAAGDEGFAVVLWDMARGKIRRVIPSHGDFNHAVVFSPDGRFLAIGSRYSKEITVQDLRRGGKRRVLRGHTANLCTLDFSPDSTRLASGGQDGTIRIWDIVEGKEKQHLALKNDE